MRRLIIPALVILAALTACDSRPDNGWPATPEGRCEAAMRVEMNAAIAEHRAISTATPYQCEGLPLDVLMRLSFKVLGSALGA